MSNPLISVTSASDSKESPVTITYLTEIISENVTKTDETNKFVELLLEKLLKKSSKHKFLIQATRLKAPDTIDTNLNISTSFGAVWDTERDGYVSFKVQLTKNPDKRVNDPAQIQKDGAQGKEKEQENATVLDDNHNEIEERQQEDEGLDDKGKDTEVAEESNTADSGDQFEETVVDHIVLDTKEDLEEADKDKPDGTTESVDRVPVSEEKLEAEASLDTILVCVHWVFVD